ncbi:hypothetical protein CDAIGKPJ_02580 [Aeromonas salmonicida]
MQGGAGPLGHLNLLDVIQIEAETAHLVVEIVGTEAVADPDPVLDDQHPVAANAADADVLRTPCRAGHRNAGFVLEHVGEFGGDLAIQVLFGDDCDGARDIGQLLFDPLALDHYGLARL